MFNKLSDKEEIACPGPKPGDVNEVTASKKKIYTLRHGSIKNEMMLDKEMSEGVCLPKCRDKER